MTTQEEIKNEQAPFEKEHKTIREFSTQSAFFKASNSCTRKLLKKKKKKKEKRLLITIYISVHFANTAQNSVHLAVCEGRIVSGMLHVSCPWIYMCVCVFVCVCVYVCMCVFYGVIGEKIKTNGDGKKLKEREREKRHERKV